MENDDFDVAEPEPPFLICFIANDADVLSLTSWCLQCASALAIFLWR
jgi:hypothetical protein